MLFIFFIEPKKTGLKDNSKIIHIDDPIAQQSSNPLTYVFPPGTDVDEYFKRKQKHFQHKPPNRRDLKNLSLNDTEILLQTKTIYPFSWKFCKDRQEMMHGVICERKCPRPTMKRH